VTASYQPLTTASIDYGQITTLMEHGYTITFEASGVGDYFCLLRRIQTQELVNCVVGSSLAEALNGAAQWDASERPGNGAGSRVTVDSVAAAQVLIAEKLDDVTIYGRDTRRELLTIIGDLRRELLHHGERITYVESRIPPYRELGHPYLPAGNGPAGSQKEEKKT
jgi:hypothetical protein